MARQAVARQFADWTADKVRIPAIPYVEGRRSVAGTDCINLIGWGLEELTGVSYERGSNSAWRKDMMWCGTIKEAKAQGYLIPGTIVYILDPPTKKWPDGNYGHAGVYVGFEYGLKNPDGKPADVVHASQSRKGVYGSILAKNGWTHAALHKGIDYTAVSDEAYVMGFAPGELEETSETKDAVPVQTGPASGQVMVSKPGVYMRRQPKIVNGTNHNRICTMPQGMILPILEQHGGWTRVPYLIHKGWIRDDMLTFGGED